MDELPSYDEALRSTNFHTRNTNFDQIQTFSPHDDDPTQIPHEKIAFGALYNSRERFDPPRCHPQTRTAVLDHITLWASSSYNDAKPILWLSGEAGAGKSAIAQTLTERWRKQDILALAYFFWRTSSERNQSTHLVPTLAFELLKLEPSVRSGVKEAVGDGWVFKASLEFQISKLLVEPLREMSKSQGKRPVVIVIDGLDECCVDLPKSKDFPGQTYQSQQQEILEALGSACRELPFLRVLIVSRPQQQIQTSFQNGFLEKLTTSLSLEDITDSSTDIYLYLDSEFEEIRKWYKIESSWPTEAQVSELVRRSSGRFIYPSAILKHITRARAKPMQSLMAVLDLKSELAKDPLAELDTLYTFILKFLSQASLRVVTDILGYMLPYKSNGPLVSEIYKDAPHEKSLTTFEKLLFLKEGEAEVHLDDLDSVLDIPPWTARRPITFAHATFSEYLQNKSRSKDFYISKEQVSIRYTQLLFKHLNEWGSNPGDQLYDIDRLVLCTCHWINDCPTSKSLMLSLWSLMNMELGGQPYASDQANQDSPPSTTTQPSTEVVSVSRRNSGIWAQRDLVEYLQKCNIPEFEPSWWRRLFVRLRLQAALLRSLD